MRTKQDRLLIRRGIVQPVLPCAHSLYPLIRYGCINICGVITAESIISGFWVSTLNYFKADRLHISCANTEQSGLNGPLKLGNQADG